jgi:DNA-binding NtrC family response regulator
MNVVSSRPSISDAEAVPTGRGEAGVDQEPLVPEAAWAEFAMRSVGRLSLNEVKEHVTTSMLKAALERSRGNYTHAARLLGITRQAVQYLTSRHAPRAAAAARQPLRTSLARH